MSDTYDAIVLGSGHNSLVLLAYLARAGLDVGCLEAAEAPGGGLATAERPAGSGFLHNIHSFFHRGITHMPWYQELQLERHGARYLEPPLNVALICKDGRTLQWWNDFDKTAESFSAFSPDDARMLRYWRDRFRPIVRDILEPEAQSPPLPPAQRDELLARSPAGRLLLETSRLSPLEFVEREFRHPTVKAALLFFNGLREVDLRCPGLGHHIPSLLASDRMAQMCAGGSQRLADALVACVEQFGGKFHFGAKPRRILVQQQRVVGVETADGDLIRARKLVASGLNPHQTFLELIGPEHLPSVWMDRVRQFRYNVIAPLFSLNVNLRDPPRYRAAELQPELDGALMVVAGIDDAARFDEIVRHHEAGTIPSTVMWGSCPTRFDPSQAPAGHHTAFMWEKLPYRLFGDPHNWDRQCEEHARVMLDLWTQYAPNLADSVIDWFASSPLDIERRLPNMKYGDLLVGAFSNGQIGYHRPFPGAGHYRGHLDGLYLCGSCCHPGGNITGLPGYNCAQVICADLGIGG